MRKAALRGLRAASTLMLFVVVAASAAAAVDGETPLHPLCADDERLDVLGFVTGFGAARDAVRREAEARGIPPLAVVALGLDDEEPDERCAWNRALFLDFVLYFGLTEALDERSPPLEVARARDRLFDAVYAHVVLGTDRGFAEWSSIDVRGDSLDAFLARGSERFAWIERAVALVHTAPEARADDAEGAARLLAHRALSARTPFSSVETELALALAVRPSTTEALTCLARALDESACDEDVFSLARACAEDEGRALVALGVFAAQRMYLARDLTTFVRARASDDEEARRVLGALTDGARAHARLETRGLRCGARSLYPKGFVDDAPSNKPYHFFAVAHLAHTLARMGVDEESAREAALVDAALYKRAIRGPGMAVNLALGRPVDDGTAGDTARVLAEQASGARFGIALFRDARARGDDDGVTRVRSVSLGPALDRALVDVRFDPMRSSALLVTVRERHARPSFGIGFTTSREVTWRVDLGPGEKDALLARGLPLPGVSLDDDTLRVRY